MASQVEALRSPMNVQSLRATVRDACETIAPAALLRSYRFREIDKNLHFTRSRSGRFEAELALLPMLLADSAGGSAIDVGANVGDYTYMLQKLVGAAHTYAVEPQAALKRRLERLFPNVNLFELGLSDRSGELRLKTPIVKGMALRSRATLEPFSEIGETGATFATVRLETLDRLCDSEKIRNVRFIKIDVEGHEHRVIAGARRVLAAWRPVLQIEIEQRHRTEPIGDLFSALSGYGYAGYYLHPRAQRMLPIGDFSVREHQDIALLGKPGYVNNFLFFDRSAAGKTVDAVHRHLQAERT